MRRWLPILSLLVALSLLLSSCEQFPIVPEAKVVPEFSDLCDKEGVWLTADVEGEEGLRARGAEAAASWGVGLDWHLQWFKDGEPIPGANEPEYFATEPGEYYVALVVCGGGPEYTSLGAAYGEDECRILLTTAPAVVAPCEKPEPTKPAPTEPTPTEPAPVEPTPTEPVPVESGRVDVSAVIYGGWNGIPVTAWVGGTEQETLFTEQDGSGLPAVLWTFYPPAGKSWTVTVAPQTPAGLDPERWQYRLVRIVEPLRGTEVLNPGAASVTIARGTQYVLYFQLVDTGALPAE